MSFATPTSHRPPQLASQHPQLDQAQECQEFQGDDDHAMNVETIVTFDLTLKITMMIIQTMVDNGTYHGWRLCEDDSGEKGNQIMIDALEMESDGVAFWVYKLMLSTSAYVKK